MNQSRRDFVIQGLSLGVLAILKSPPASAYSFLNSQLFQARRTGFFVCLVPADNAGLDCTLGLDPILPSTIASPLDAYLEYRDADISTVHGLRLGPSALALSRHASDVAVINGIQMGADKGHPALLQYMQSGDSHKVQAILSVIHATSFESTELGLLHNGATIFAPGPTSVFTDLDRLLGPGEHTQDEEVRLMASAFVSGKAFDAQFAVRTSGNLDTHRNHPGTHLQAQKEFWDSVSTIFDYFKSIPYKNGSLFEATTFFVSNEFSRTPALNPNSGKDHNPMTNSCLIAGKNVRGGQTFGRSQVIARNPQNHSPSLHVGCPFEFETGTSDFIRPENVTETLRSVLGLRPSPGRIIPNLGVRA
ncbi:MAG: DUF1501 domain-containing protein [Bdellovibrionales bacterium]|nr:DUF1501 domain-containing protein [Bdellovibrionales bacterium]